MSEPPWDSNLFVSRRERRLWLFAGLLVIGIYSTLGLASTLADYLYHQGLSAAILLICMAVVGLVIFTQGLKVRPKGIEIGVGLALALVYLMIVFRLTIPERSHLIEYSVVAVLFYEALYEGVQRGRRTPVPAILAIILTTMVGAIDEWIQLFLPSRVFDWNDILFNFLAALMAVISMSLLAWARRWAIRLLGDEKTESSRLH